MFIIDEINDKIFLKNLNDFSINRVTSYEIVSNMKIISRPPSKSNMHQKNRDSYEKREES